MALLEQIKLFAEYNRWMNERLCDAAAALSEDSLHADSGAYFKSIIGTLNHLLVGDILWLGRFHPHADRYTALSAIAAREKPASFDQILHADIEALRADRYTMDSSIVAWSQQIAEGDLERPLIYRNMRGDTIRKNFGSLVLHLFNHQTHHRGQLTTLLAQAGVRFEPTDLVMLVPDVDL